VSRWLVVTLLVGLWFLRVPSLAQPMAGDQGLYAYAGERLLAGDAPYAGAWDQKPPGIHVIYAVMWAVWPHESVVAGADLIAAGLIAFLLILIGRRHFTDGIGVGAAAVFLFFGNPSLPQSLGGVYVRGQCETFIALAITAAIALAAGESRTRRHLIGIGVLLGCAFWLKYNAAAYALVVLVALAMWPRNGEPSLANFRRDVAWVTGAGALTVALPLLAMAWSGSLLDLRLATIDYNLAYSGDTYAEQGPLKYLLTFPIARARNDALWLLGGLGCLAAAAAWLRAPRDERALCGLVALSWVVAACGSILINGARDLPQYFVQAAPALALVAAVGLAPLLRGWRTRPVVPAVVMLLLVFAVSRPGDRGHLPRLGEYLVADWSALTGRTDRQTYLTRWFTGKKMMAGEVDALAANIKATTLPSDAIYVFGFSPGVFVKSDRRSASRFHWSRPVVIEFAAEHPGYGSAALLDDLTRERPAVVALQKQDWGPGEPNSIEFFHEHPDLETWLVSGYTRERETTLFEVWRRR
jgi:hypothetical protein